MAGAGLQFTIDAQQLRDVLTASCGSAGTDKDLPILGHVNIAAQDGCVTLTTTDLNSQSQASAPAEVRASGSVTVPVYDLVGFAKHLRGNVEIELHTRLSVKAGKASCELPVLADPFPFMVAEDCEFIELPAKTLRTAIASVQHCVAPDSEIIRALQGVLFETDPDGLKLVACARHRMAVYEIEGVEPINPIVLPKQSISEALRLLDRCGDGPVRLGFPGVKLRLEGAGESFTTKTVEGEYVRWRSFTPTESEIEIGADPKALKQAVATICALRQSKHKRTMRVSTNGTGIDLSIVGDERIAADNHVDCEISGEGQVGMNPDYVAEALDRMSEGARILIRDATSPVRFEVPGSPLRQIIMTMRT